MEETQSFPPPQLVPRKGYLDESQTGHFYVAKIRKYLLCLGKERTKMGAGPARLNPNITSGPILGGQVTVVDDIIFSMICLSRNNAY